MSTIPELFGSMVFDDKVMRARLSADVYHSLKETIRRGKKLKKSGRSSLLFSYLTRFERKQIRG